MHHLIAATALALASSTPATSGGGCDANVESDYDLNVTQRSVILTRDSDTPRAIVMRHGALFIDDAWVTLTEGDSRRVAMFEQEARAALPEAQAIGRAAADIAFVALAEVAAGFSTDPARSQVKLAKARADLDTRLARSVSATRFDGRDLAGGISQAVGAVLPSMTGDIVGGAISAAFLGDASRLRQLENLEAQIEAKVAPRARALEARAAGLCRRMMVLDQIEDALEYRHGYQPLDLLRVGPRAEPTGPQ